MAERKKDQRESRSESGDDTVFDRLDGLRREEAERILERAIRLSDEQEDEGGRDRNLSVEEIARIAAELGIGAATVQKALREELREGPKRQYSRYPFLGPKHVVGRSAVSGTVGDVSETVIAWMETEEGLRPVTRHDNGIVWEKDTHWATSLRLAAGTEATKVLRGLASVTHNQRSLSEKEQLVEIEADTGRVRMTAGGVGGGIALAGVGGGIGMAFGIPGGNDLVQFILIAGPTTVIGLGTAWGIARAWIGEVEKGINRALTGVSERDLYRRAERRKHRRAQSTTPRGGPLSRFANELKRVTDDFFD
ncbi:MAG: hypothetical protein GEU79_17445 [Acidimicrobiia bacterium]|nr:hypothetical protein [Acidimicrobiia bacterium]